MLNVRLPRARASCKTVPLLLLTVKSASIFICEGIIIPVTLPVMVIDEVFPATRLVNVPEIGFFNVKRYAPNVKSPSVKVKAPLRTIFAFKLAPPELFTVRLLSAVIVEGILKAVVPSSIRLEVEPPTNVLPTRIPFNVSVLPLISKLLPLLKVRLFTVWSISIATSAPALIVTLVVTELPTGNSFRLPVIADEPVYCNSRADPKVVIAVVRLPFLRIIV